MHKRVTLADVAARAGLSKTAVSLVLNDRPGSRLSADAVERIHTAARELNYRPNPAARSLRIGKTRTVGFVSDEVTVTRFASAMIRGLLDVADEHDHGVLIAETGDHPKQLEKALEFMIDRQVDGIVFGSMAARLIEVPDLPEGIRAVTANATSTTAHSAVLPAEEEAGYRVARLLLDAGHRDGIGIVGYTPRLIADPGISATIGSRFAGIGRALDEADVVPAVKAEFEAWEPANGYNATKNIIESGLEITALICLNDRVAFGASQALTEHGAAVPEDVSIASFDDDVLASYMRPGLTTAKLPYEEIGRRAMAQLLDPDAPRGIQLVDMPIQLRQSISRPRP
jgi:LacI family transcriptional regulator